MNDTHSLVTNIRQNTRLCGLHSLVAAPFRLSGSRMLCLQEFSNLGPNSSELDALHTLATFGLGGEDVW